MGGVGDNSSAITYFFYPLLGGGLVDAPQIGQSYLLLLVLVFFLLTKVKQHTQSEIVEKVKEGQRRSEVTWQECRIMITHVASSFFPS